MNEMLDEAMSTGRKEVTLHLFNDSFSSCLSPPSTSLNLPVAPAPSLPQPVQHLKKMALDKRNSVTMASK